MNKTFKKIVVRPINISVDKPKKKGKRIILKNRLDVVMFIEDYMSDWFEIEVEE